MKKYIIPHLILSHDEVAWVCPSQHLEVTSAMKRHGADATNYPFPTQLVRDGTAS
jgi:hypothetical protein